MRTKPRLIHNATTKTHAPARAGRTSARSELKATPRSGAAPTPPHNPRSKTPSALPPPPPPPLLRITRDPYQIRPPLAAIRTRSGRDPPPIGPGARARRRIGSLTDRLLRRSSSSSAAAAPAPPAAAAARRRDRGRPRRRSSLSISGAAKISMRAWEEGEEEEAEVGGMLLGLRRFVSSSPFIELLLSTSLPPLARSRCRDALVDGCFGFFTFLRGEAKLFYSASGTLQLRCSPRLGKRGRRVGGRGNGINNGQRGRGRSAYWPLCRAGRDATLRGWRKKTTSPTAASAAAVADAAVKQSRSLAR